MIDDSVLILKPEQVQIDPTARLDRFVRVEGGQGVTIIITVTDGMTVKVIEEAAASDLEYQWGS